MTNPFDSARRCAYAPFAAGARLGLGLLALGALACAKGGDAPPAGDTARAVAAETTATVPASPATTAVSTAPTDSATPSRTTKDGAEQQKSRAATPTSEAARLDSATRASARAGAKTRDTARTGAVTPAPVTRKTATNVATTKTGAAATTKAPTTTTPPVAKTDSAPSTPSGAATGAGAAPAGGQQTASGQSDDKLTASPAAYQGWKMFHVYCYRCHGTDAMGSDLAPNLRHSVGPEGSVTHEVFVTTVKEGRLPKGMPAWKAILSDEQIENLWAYLKARSSGSLAAGRPRQAKSE